MWKTRHLEKSIKPHLPLTSFSKHFVIEEKINIRNNQKKIIWNKLVLEKKGVGVQWIKLWKSIYLWENKIGLFQELKLKDISY